MKKPDYKALKWQIINQTSTIDQYHQKEEQWRKDRIALEARVAELERILGAETDLKETIRDIIKEGNGC